MKNIVDHDNKPEEGDMFQNVSRTINNLLSYLREHINLPNEFDFQKEFHNMIIPYEEEFLNKYKMLDCVEDFRKFHDIIIKSYVNIMYNQNNKQTSLLKNLDNGLKQLLNDIYSLEKNFRFYEHIQKIKENTNIIVHVTTFDILVGENKYNSHNWYTSKDIELILKQKSKCEADLCNTMEQLELMNTKFINICNQLSIMKIENEKLKHKLKNNLHQSESSFSSNSSHKQAFIKEINELHIKLEKYDKETKEMKIIISSLEESLFNKNKLYELICRTNEELHEKYSILLKENKDIIDQFTTIRDENLKYKKFIENLNQMNKSIQILLTNNNNSMLFKEISLSKKNLTENQMDCNTIKNYYKLSQYFTDISKSLVNFEFIKDKVFNPREFKIISKKFVNKINKTFFLISNKDENLHEYIWLDEKSIVEKDFENESRELSTDYLKEIEDLKIVNNELLDKICLNNKDNLVNDFQYSFTIKNDEKIKDKQILQETCETEENYLKKGNSHKELLEYKPRNSKLVKRKDFILD